MWETRLEAMKASGSGAKVFTFQSVGDALKLPSEVATEVVQLHIETALEVFQILMSKYLKIYFCP